MNKNKKNDVMEFADVNLGLNVRAILDNKNEPWFVAADVLSALGYSVGGSKTSVLNRLDASEKKVSAISTTGGVQNVAMVNESGLYYLICSSKLPKAKKFRLWVTSVVLPSIRKYGGYIKRMERLKKSQRVILENTIKDLTKKVDSLTSVNNKLIDDKEKLQNEVDELNEQMTLRLYGDGDYDSLKIETTDGQILTEKEYLAYYG